ncbi:uncharacterized protein PG986_012979 [Apiospora aurea]|uniref:Uncharacterized protein n=1 Tax=Apiospora aurea TaxID=335848 RepID=A0ABR1Q2R3_9PEZI
MTQPPLPRPRDAGAVPHRRGGAVGRWTGSEEGVRDQFLAFLRTLLSSPDGPDRMTEVGDGNWGQFVSVLLALLLPRVIALRSIRFCGIGSTAGLWLLRWVVERLAPDAPATAPPLWKELEEVEMDGKLRTRASEWLRHIPPPSSVAIAHFAALWPGVKRIYSAGYADDSDVEVLDRDYGLLEPASSPLESLVLGPYSLLCHDHLDILLQGPRALRTFHYNLGRDWAFSPFDGELLQESLEHQKASLRGISITHNHYEFGWEPDVGVVHPMSFAAFSQLRVLEVSTPFAFGEDVVCTTAVNSIAGRSRALGS